MTERDCRTDDHDPTSMTGDAREATEHEVPGTAGPQRPTSPTEQADLQGEPPQGARSTLGIGPPFAWLDARYDGSRYCPGGPAVFVNTRLHIAQCPGGCDIWFDTMMDEPTFPPHTVMIATTVTSVTFGPADAASADIVLPRHPHTLVCPVCGLTRHLPDGWQAMLGTETLTCTADQVAMVETANG